MLDEWEIRISFYKPNKIVPPFSVHNEISLNLRLHSSLLIEITEMIFFEKVQIFLENKNVRKTLMPLFQLQSQTKPTPLATAVI